MLATYNSNMWIPILSTFIGYTIHPYSSLTGLILSLIVYTNFTEGLIKGQPEYNKDRYDSFDNWSFKLIKGYTSVCETFSSKDRSTVMSSLCLKVIWNYVMYLYFTISLNDIHNNDSVMKFIIYGTFITGIMASWMDKKSEVQKPYSLVQKPIKIHGLLMMFYSTFKVMYGVLHPNLSSEIHYFCGILGIIMLILNLTKKMVICGMHMRPIFVILEFCTYTFVIPHVYYKSSL